MSRHDLTAYQGETFSQTFTVYGPDGLTTVGDLTGYSVRGTIRPSIGSATTTETFTGTVTTPAGAVCNIALTAAETTAITAGVYVYDVEVYSGPVVLKAMHGLFTVIGEVTT